MQPFFQFFVTNLLKFGFFPEFPDSFSLQYLISSTPVSMGLAEHSYYLLQCLIFVQNQLFDGNTFGNTFKIIDLQRLYDSFWGH